MNEVLQQFLLESRDFLQGIATSLMALERTPDDAALMDELFRYVHTLKGNCGLFDFPDMFRVIHAAEDLMSEVREGRLAYSRALADLLLDAMDFVSSQLDGIEAGGQPAAAPQASLALAERLRAQAADAAGACAAGGMPGAAPDQAAAADDGAMQAALALAPAALRAQCLDAAAAGAPWHWIEYLPEAECFFKGEDPLYQAMQLPGLAWQRVQAAGAWPALDQLDPYRCNLRLQMVSSAPRAEIEQHFRYVPEQVDIAPILTLAAEPVQPWTAAALALAQGQAEALWTADGAPWVAGRLRAAVAAIRACMQASAREVGLEELAHCEAEALRLGAPDPVLAWLERHAGTGSGAPDASPASAPPAALAGQAQANATVGKDPVGQDPAPARRPDEGGAARVLRVEQGKIDHLMNLIGEMVVARNALPYLAGRAETQYGVRDLAREIKAQHAVINRIVDEMQHAIMQVRMTPVSFVFQRFPRLVRDISRRLGKEVELVLEGEATEADKNVIEALADPLVHIVRNALDHGIELPEARLAAGKPAAGRLVIGARQEADRVLIEVRDDGKGIDPAAIRRKAYERGLIDEDALERLDDRAAINLVFLPGFSTADQVTDLSGRGVGMDAVRSAVEALGGTVELSSAPGAGSRLQLALPLSMAVTTVMVVESGGAQYGVPMTSVVETVRVAGADLHAIGQRQAAVLRGRIVPLSPMNELLALPQAQRPNAEGELATLVLRLHGQEIGLVVDEFRGVMEVILKPLSGILGALGAYAGSALMGDGSVLMVINPKELLQ